MKLKLFGNTGTVTITATVLNGGYDTDAGRMIFMIRNEEQSGMLAFDPIEARRIAECILASTPQVERVENMSTSLKKQEKQETVPGVGSL